MGNCPISAVCLGLPVNLMHLIRGGVQSHLSKSQGGGEIPILPVGGGGGVADSAVIRGAPRPACRETPGVREAKSPLTADIKPWRNIFQQLIYIWKTFTVGVCRLPGAEFNTDITHFLDTVKFGTRPSIFFINLLYLDWTPDKQVKIFSNKV